MGITGLLPLLRPITKAVHVGNYAGQTIAIDAYSWIHKGMYGSALDLLEGKPNRRYIDYCVIRAKFLLQFKIKVIFVFDGGHLPMKEIEEQERKQRREENKKLALKALKKGDRSSAWQYANKGVNVTTEMAYKLMLDLQANGIDYIVAPYEADAQMAYLCKIGMVDAILTEDSDLLLFECPKILYKFKIDDGYVEEIQLANLPKVKKDLDFGEFTPAMLRQMCILSGCDYLPSIPKMGLKTAHRFVRTYVDAEKVLRAIISSRQFAVPENYEKSFELAELTFIYQRVFCPLRKCIVTLSEDVNCALSKFPDLDFLGPFIEDSIAQGISNGTLCAATYKPFSSALSPSQKENNKENMPMSATAVTSLLEIKPLNASQCQADAKGSLMGGMSKLQGVATQAKEKFWNRITLKKPVKALDPQITVFAPNKKQKVAQEPQPMSEPSASPYFSNSVESDKLLIVDDVDAPLSKSPLSLENIEKFYEKESAKTKGEPIHGSKCVRSPRFSDQANALPLSENVSHYFNSFAASPSMATLLTTRKSSRINK